MNQSSIEGMNKITSTKHCEFCGTELTTPLSDDIRWVPEVNPEYKMTIRKFRKAGAEIEFKILPGLNHIQACNQAYTAESIEFLLKH